MPEENKQEEPKKEEPVFDPAKFKEEVAGMNKSYVDQVSQNLINHVTQLINSKEQGIKQAEELSKSSDIELEDYKSEIEELGLDDKGAKALMGLLGKIVKKKAPEVERNVIEKVDQSMNIKDKKQYSEDQVMKKFPQVMDHSSNLWKQSQKRYADLSDAIKNSPEGTSIAVELAASDLGIRAATPYQGNANEASPHPGGGQQKESKASDDQIEFAKSFGVKEDTFRKKLKMISAR